jgi:Zn-finger nucleic acid-binding protein
MKCPVDNSDLVMSDRQGIEIDYCPKCRGVWLDRGELDKIIERSAPGEQPRQAYGEERSREPERRDYGRDDDRRDYRGDDRKPYKKKRGFLDDIFDF